MSLTFNVGGLVLRAEQVEAIYKAPGKPKASGVPKAFHKGWSVEGYPPGQIEQAERDARDASARWGALSPERQAQRMRSGDRPPRAWSVDDYCNRHKPKKVRAHPFGAQSAADEMKALAERQGWERVRVVELKQGDASGLVWG